MSSNLLKTKIPYATSLEDILDSYNYAVKTLNSSFVKDPISAPEQGVVGIATLDGIQLSQSWSGSGAFINNYTLNHNLGTVPSGWILIDNESSGFVAGGSLSIYRVSWTTTQIVITISVDKGAVGSISGSFKILVLR